MDPESGGPKPAVAEAPKVETGSPPSAEVTQKAQEGQQVAGELQTTVDAGNAEDIDSAVKDFANELDSVDNHADLAAGGQPHMVTEEVPDAGTDTADQNPAVTNTVNLADEKNGTPRTPDQIAQLTGNQPNTETPAVDTAQSMASDKPLTADDIRAEAMRQRRDGIITPEQAQQAIDHADEVAQRNDPNAKDTSAPLFPQQNNEQSTAETPNDRNEPRDKQREPQPAQNTEATREVNPPLAEATPEGVVAEAENATREAAGETKDDSNENKADAEKTPEQEAAELALGRDNLVKNLLKENPNLDLSTKEVQNYLKLAQENPQNMETLSAMTEKFMGAQAKESAEKLGLDPESFGKGSVDGIIDNIQKQLDELKKKIGETGGTEAQKAEADKKGWLMKLLKALAGVMGQVLIASGAAAKGAGETLTGKTDNKK